MTTRNQQVIMETQVTNQDKLVLSIMVHSRQANAVSPQFVPVKIFEGSEKVSKILKKGNFDFRHFRSARDYIVCKDSEGYLILQI